MKNLLIIFFLLYSYCSFAFIEESIFKHNLSEWEIETFGSSNSSSYYIHQKDNLKFFMRSGYTAWDKEKKCADFKAEKEIQVHNKIFCQNSAKETQTITTFVKSNQCAKCYKYYSITIKKSIFKKIIEKIEKMI